MISRDKGMPIKSTVRHAHGFSRPVTGMLLALAASVVLCGTLAGFLLYPAMMDQQELERRYAEKSLAFTAELQRKAAEVVEPEELAALLRRVPTRPERESLILALREIGRQSGVEILSMKSGSGAEAQGVELPGIIGSLAGGLGAQQQQQQQETSGRRQGNGVYEEIRYELELTGTWRQAEDFVRRINKWERLVTIPEWHIAAQSPDASWRSQPMTMTVVLVMYAGTGFEGKFPGAAKDGLQGGGDE